MSKLKVRTPEERKAYWEGVRAALRWYAWGRDGEQYVGSCGTKLKDALQVADDMEKTGLDHYGGG